MIPATAATCSGPDPMTESTAMISLGRTLDRIGGKGQFADAFVRPTNNLPSTESCGAIS